MTSVITYGGRQLYNVTAMPGRRVLSSALALLLTAVAALPLFVVLEADDVRCCRRGVCCHKARPSADACVRGVCRCAAHGETGDPAPAGWPVAVLPVERSSFTIVGAEPIHAWCVTLVGTWQPDVPHPPPQYCPAC
jgi:hypothetical protein